MSITSKSSQPSNFTIHIKRQAEHLLSNPVFYTHNPPHVSKLTLNMNEHNASSNIGCTNCINKDLQQKKRQQSNSIKKQDKAFCDANKIRVEQKQQKDIQRKKQKQDWFRKDLDNHSKLHNQQKIKQKQRDNEQTEQILKIMRSQILINQQKQRRHQKERSISQLQLKQGLNQQLKQKRIEKEEKMQQQRKNTNEIPSCIPLVSSHKSRNSLNKINYKIDLDQMIKQKQQVKRNQSSQIIEKERTRLLKVIQKQQFEQSRIQNKKNKLKNQEIQVMKSNIKQIEDKKNITRLQKENQQPIKAFFDQDKRKAKAEHKINIWKTELKEAMIKQNNNGQVLKDEKRNNRNFSSYRSRQNNISDKKSLGIQIVVKDDKVCCSKCHEAKPSYAVGNYNFEK